MELIILEAVCETTGSTFESIEEAELQYSKLEMFDMVLKYEGIFGYTGKIIAVLSTLGIITDSDAAVL